MAEERVRVLAITPAYPPSSMVGAWCATHLFLRHLITLGHEARAFAYLARHDTYTHEGVEVVSGSNGRAYALNLASDVDVIVSHCGDGGLGADVAKRVNRPSVRMVHGAMPNAGRADLFIFNSESLRAATRHVGPSVVCHPPVDVGWWQMARPYGDRITLIGMSEPKGVHTFAALADRLPDREFLGVRGNYGLQRPPRARNVEVMGPVPDLRPVYASTRILLMPSSIETWGMTAVEAMAAGIPVIAHPTPGLLESLGPAGIFVDRDDVDGWEREIRRLGDEGAYQRASGASLRRALELVPAPSLDRFAEAVGELVGVVA